MLEAIKLPMFVKESESMLRFEKIIVKKNTLVSSTAITINEIIVYII